jgi:hypothetical protein
MATQTQVASSLSLASLLASFVAISARQQKAAVIHAGHYALFRRKDGQVTDCLDEADSTNDILGFAKFCRATWSAACQANASASATARPRLIVLVNDWQYITNSGDKSREGQQAADRIRSEYYRRTATLPLYHLDELRQHGIETDAILTSEKDRWVFSETALRNELHPIVKKLLADRQRAQEVGVKRYFNEDGEPIVEICDDEAGKLCLLYCGNTNCAGEVVSLLGNLYQRGIRYFLNVFPSQCREPVSAGTRLAYKIFDCDDFSVTNAAVNATSNGEDSLVFVESFGRQA